MLYEAPFEAKECLDRSEESTARRLVIRLHRFLPQ